MPQNIKDHRTDRKDAPILWALATDKFMSGWGRAAGGKSYVAYPIYADTPFAQRKELINWLEWRNDFIRVRESTRLTRLGPNDHLSIYDLPTMEEIKSRYRVNG